MTPRTSSHSVSEILRMIVATGLIATLFYTTVPIAAQVEILIASPKQNTQLLAGTASRPSPSKALKMPSVTNSEYQASGAPNSITITGISAAAIALGSAAHYRLSQDSQWRDYEDVVVVAVLNGMAKMAANSGSSLTNVDYDLVKRQVRDWLNAKAPPNPIFSDEVACIRYAINALVPLVNGSPVSPLLPAVLGNLENSKFVQLETSIDPNRQRPSDLAFYAVSEHSGPFIMEVMQEASDLAHNDPSYAAAINPILQELVGMDTDSSYSQIQTEYQGAIPNLHPSNNDGSFTIALQDLQSQYQSIVRDAQSVVDGYLVSIQQSAPAVALKAGPLTAQAGSSPCIAGTVFITANQCTTAGGASIDYWSKAQSGVDGLSNLIGKMDPQSSTQVSTVGGAVIQVGKAVGQISNILGGGSLGLSSLIGLVNPVAGVIGAGFSIFQSFFGGDGPKDSAILDQINKLSQQITALQQDVDSQFQQVNSELNTILQTLNNDFKSVDWQLGVLQGDAHGISAGLLDVQSQISQLEQYTLAYDQAVSKETLISEMNGCLYYAAVHNRDIGRSVYAECENDFYSWAHDSASDHSGRECSSRTTAMATFTALYPTSHSP